MPPKKKDVKQERGEQKALEKQKQKIVEDKTFGLKNKNKSKAVQKYIKGMQQQSKGPVKGGESELLRRQNEEKEEKKKKVQQELLLQSLFKGTENMKRIAEDAEQKKAYDPKTSRQDQKINLYIDQRQQKQESTQSASQDTSTAASVDFTSKTDITCKYFIQAVEKKQYGWLWICPNGGDNCLYRHCLPQGYVWKEEASHDAVEEGETVTLEESIEMERASLPTDGTPVTFETFTAWKKRKEEERQKLVEDQRKAEAQRTGTRGLHILSGRDLFTYDPTLFVDAEGAAFGEDYEELDVSLDETIAENQRIVDQANKDARERREAEAVGENMKREDGQAAAMGALPINASLFLEEDLPEDLDDLDE